MVFRHFYAEYSPHKNAETFSFFPQLSVFFSEAGGKSFFRP
jgi:hypothetical protein